jgi:phage shock protein A
MGDQVPDRRVAARRDGLPGRGRKPWQSKPASEAPRWLLGRIGFWVAIPGLAAAYQRQRLTVTRVRRAAASVATSRKRLELQIWRLEQQSAEAGGQSDPGTAADQGGVADEGQLRREPTERRLADLRRQYADLQAEEERVTAASRRLQANVNEFGAAKEAVEAAYAAAEEAAEAAWAEVTGSHPES